MDKAARWTDKKLIAMEKRLTGIYSRAQSEIGEKWTDYMSKVDAKAEPLLKALKDAKSPEEREKASKAYKQLVEAETLRNEHFRALTVDYAKNLTEVSRIANAYVNEQLPQIYAENYNAIGEEIDAQVKGYSFEAVNQDVVKRLATENKTLLPYKTLDDGKHIRWNTKKVNAEVTQGILQGESIPDIAKRLRDVTSMDLASSIRNARTTTTSAQNKGRIDSFHAAEEKGVILKKVWLATHDTRTREEHLELDGQEKDVDEPFENSLGEIMYPGDINADPANVYNCRCTLITKVLGFEWNADVSKAEEAEAEEQKPAAPPFESAKLKKVLNDEDYTAFCGLVDNAPTHDLFAEYSGKCRSINLTKDEGEYWPAADTLNFCMQNVAGQSKYSVLAHEMSHMFDAKIGENSSLSFGELNTINEACKTGSGRFKLLKNKPSMSDDFLNALREDMNALEGKVKDRSIRAELCSTAVWRNATSGVQDALDGFYGTQKKGLLPWGHGDVYYNGTYNRKVISLGVEKKLKDAFTQLGFDASNQDKVKALTRQYKAASEAWANVGSALTCGGEELEAMKKYMPKSLSAFEKITKGLQ